MMKQLSAQQVAKTSPPELLLSFQFEVLQYVGGHIKYGLVNLLLSNCGCVLNQRCFFLTVLFRHRHGSTRSSTWRSRKKTPSAVSVSAGPLPA